MNLTIHVLLDFNINMMYSLSIQPIHPYSIHILAMLAILLMVQKSQTTTWNIQNLVNNENNYHTSTGDCRISEPSTLSIAFFFVGVCPVEKTPSVGRTNFVWTRSRILRALPRKGFWEAFLAVQRRQDRNLRKSTVFFPTGGQSWVRYAQLKVYFHVKVRKHVIIIRIYVMYI